MIKKLIVVASLTCVWTALGHAFPKEGRADFVSAVFDATQKPSIIGAARIAVKPVISEKGPVLFRLDVAVDFVNTGRNASRLRTMGAQVRIGRKGQLLPAIVTESGGIEWPRPDTGNLGHLADSESLLLPGYYRPRLYRLVLDTRNLGSILTQFGDRTRVAVRLLLEINGFPAKLLLPVARGASRI